MSANLCIQFQKGTHLQRSTDTVAAQSTAHCQHVDHMTQAGIVSTFDYNTTYKNGIYFKILLLDK